MRLKVALDGGDVNQGLRLGIWGGGCGCCIFLKGTPESMVRALDQIFCKMGAESGAVFPAADAGLSVFEGGLYFGFSTGLLRARGCANLSFYAVVRGMRECV